jgi:hypothetical protein
MLFERLAVVGIALGLLGCAGVEEGHDESVSFRCLPGGGVGMVGLDSVEVTGTPTVSGPFGSVFSNEHIFLAGAYDLEGSAVSGGSVTIANDANSPGGSVVENAQKVSVADPTDDVLRAKEDNDNCPEHGSICISDYQLVLNDGEVTLPTGVYYLENIRINGQAKLNVDGNVVIYLNGPATFNGGSATNPDEDSLTIISSSTESIRLNGAAQSAMHVLAPFASVHFAGTQGFKGTALGKHLVVTGTAEIEATASLADVFGVECAAEDTSTPDGIPPS